MNFEAVPFTAGGAWTVALGAILVVQGVALAPLVATGPSWAVALYLATAVLVGGLVVWVSRLARRPLQYRIEAGILLVPAHFQAVRLPLSGARVRRGHIAGARLAGTAMPPFCLGLFLDRGGRYHAAATAREGVWVEGERRVFVTPADTDGFVKALLDAGAVRIDGE